MKRRNLLKLCATAGLSFASPVGQRYLAGAEENTPESAPYEGPYYIVLNASGGWDTTYMMDPKGVNEINRLYQQDDILTQGNIRFAPNAKQISAGLSNEEFFKKYTKNCWFLMVSIIQLIIILLARDTWRLVSSTP